MKRLMVLFSLVACCAGCGSSMDTSPVVLPGAFHERLVDDREVERVGFHLVADARETEGRRSR